MELLRKYSVYSIFLASLMSPQVVISQNLENIANSIGHHLRVFEKENNFSGVVLVAKNGKPIYREAFGFANLADSIPNKVDTKFNLASMNKMFTGLAVMQLVESGKISLYDKVGKYLLEYPNKSVADSVTVHQLLTHTSGMVFFWEELDKLPKDKFKTVNDYLPLFVNQKLSFPPGTKFSYSNSAYMVLGLIIEKVTGENYFDYVKNHIFYPINMLSTDAYELDNVVHNMATGYTMSVEIPGQWKNNIFSNVVKGTPAGGGYSTVDDLLKFANALKEYTLLNEENTRLYTTGKVKYREGMYAYGVSEDTVNGHRVIGHTGGHFGIANEMMIYPDLGFVVIILTNGEVENYWEASNFIEKQLIGNTPSLDNYFFTKEIIKAVCDKGYETGIREIDRASKKLTLRESVIERYGYRFLFEKKNKEAIDLFRVNVSKFPNSPYCYYNLSEAYSLSGQKNEAMKYLKKYLEMEPEDNDAKIKYEALTK